MLKSLGRSTPDLSIRLRVSGTFFLNRQITPRFLPCCIRTANSLHFNLCKSPPAVLSACPTEPRCCLSGRRRVFLSPGESNTEARPTISPFLNSCFLASCHPSSVFLHLCFLSVRSYISTPPTPWPIRFTLPTLIVRQYPCILSEALRLNESESMVVRRKKTTTPRPRHQQNVNDLLHPSAIFFVSVMTTDQRTICVDQCSILTGPTRSR